MLSDEDKTPPTLPLPLPLPPEADRGKTPLPLPASHARPPLGRPPGALTTSELVDRVSADVRRATLAELERKHAALAAQLREEVTTAVAFGVAATVLAGLALVASLVLARATPGAVLGLTLATATALLVGGRLIGSRRMWIRLLPTRLWPGR